jgi:hypothetical protein
MKDNENIEHVNFRILIEYKCHDCTGEYSDGKVDCRKPTCPLYEYMPFKELEPKRPYLEWSRRGVGRRPKRAGNPEAARRGLAVLAERRRTATTLAGRVESDE